MCTPRFFFCWKQRATTLESSIVWVYTMLNVVCRKLFNAALALLNCSGHVFNNFTFSQLQASVVELHWWGFISWNSARFYFKTDYRGYSTFATLLCLLIASLWTAWIWTWLKQCTVCSMLFVVSFCINDYNKTTWRHVQSLLCIVITQFHNPYLNVLMWASR